MLHETFPAFFDNEDQAAADARLLEIVSAANASESLEELTSYCLDTLHLLFPFHLGFFLICDSESSQLRLIQPLRVPPDLQRELRALKLPTEFFTLFNSADGLEPLMSAVRKRLAAHKFTAPLFLPLKLAQANVGIIALAGDSHPEVQKEWEAFQAPPDLIERIGKHVGIALKRILALEKLRARDDWLFDFLNQVEDGYWQTDTEGRILVANEAALRTLKRPLDQVRGKRLDELSDIDIEGLHALRQLANRDGFVRDFVLRVRASDGEIRTIRQTVRTIRDAQGNITGMQGLFRDITAQLQTQHNFEQHTREMQLQVQQMQAVMQIGRMIQYAPRAEETLPQVARKICQILHATYVVLHLLRHDHFEIVTASDTRETRDTFPIAPYERALLESEIPLIVNNVDAREVDAQQRAILKQLNMRAALGVRLFAHSTPLGLLFVNQDEPRDWSAGETQLLQTFAQQIAYALENKRLLDEIHQQVRELESLAQAGRLISTALLPDDALPVIADEIAHVVPADYVSFHLREGEVLHLIAESHPTEAPRTLPILPHQYRILEELDTIRVNDRDQDAVHPRQQEFLARYGIIADLGVPLVAGRQALGIMYISQRRAYNWSAAQINLAKTFAQQVASALTNARLLRESQLRVKELSTLQRSAALIASSRSPENALPQAANELRRVLRADYVGFHLIEGDHFRVVTELHDRWADLKYPIELYHKPVIEHFQKIVVNDRARDARDAVHRASLEKYDVVADIGVPIVARNKTLGILFVSQYKPRKWQPNEIRLIETYAQQIAGVLDNVQLLNQLETRVHALAQLAQFNEIAVTIPDEQAIIDLTMSAGRDLFNADMVSLVLMEGDQILAIRNSTDEYYPLQPPPSSAWIMQIIANKVPFVIDAEHPFKYDEDLKKRQTFHNAQAGLLVPLVTAHQDIGVLSFTFKRPHVFTEDEKQLGHMAANQLAMAFANARLVRAQNRQIQNLTRASEFSLWCGTIHDSPALQQAAVERICKILNVRAGSVRLVQDGYLTEGASYGYAQPATRNHKIPVNSYLKGILLQKKSLVLNDIASADVPAHWAQRHLQEGFCSLLMIPMIAKDRVTGFLTLFHDKPHVWDKSEIQFGEALGNTFALALSNVQQMEMAAQKSDELQVILDSVFSGVLVTNLEGEILSWNRKAQEITSFTAEEMKGKLWHVDGPRVGKTRREDFLILEAMADNEMRFSVAPRYLAHPSGRELVLREVATPLRDRTGQVRGAVLAFWERSEELESERERVDFFNEVAHELANKLSVMITSARELRRNDLDVELRAQYAQLIGETANDFEVFHKRFKTFQREGKHEQVMETEINLEQALEHRLKLLRASKPKPRFNVRGEFDLVRADPHRLNVVLENLLNNAVKYAAPRSVISIRAECPLPHEVLLSIHNRGELIPPEVLAHLFERWQRGHSDKPGSGLGLWLVRTKLNEMGGDIRVESDAKRGTTFTITLRRSAGNLPPPAQRAETLPP